MHRVASFFLLCASLIGFSESNAAPTDSCSGVCSTTCVKPISIPDRWDDSGAGIAAWANNGIWNGENFTDTNNNKLWDPGEPFVDGSNGGFLDGIYNSELYDPAQTGYRASVDVGKQITISPGGGSPNYYTLILSTYTYSGNWANCNPTMVGAGNRIALQAGIVTGMTIVQLHNIIALDPTASWDDQCSCAVGPLSDQSPRYFVFLAHDPRKPLGPGDLSVWVTKLIGFFLEGVDSNGRITGRFAVVQRPGGASCSDGGDFVQSCAVPALSTTWGALKAWYR